MSDQRRFTRIAFDTSAVYISEDTSFHGKVLDVSLNGALFRLEENQVKPARGTRGELEFMIEGSDVTVRMKVHCTHIEDFTLGFECDSIDLDSAGFLRRLVEMNLGSEELLARELAALIQAHEP